MKQKENSPSAFFCLLRCFIPLNKKNSLRSNSFLFLTLHKTPPLNGKKKEAGPLRFFEDVTSLTLVAVGVFCSLLFVVVFMVNVIQ